MRALFLTVAALAVVASVTFGDPTPPRAQPSAGDLGSGQPNIVHDDCVCVPFYQCEDGQLITDGSDLLDVRFGPRDKCQDFKICCNVPKETVKKIEAKPGVNKGIMSKITDGIQDIFGGGGSGNGTPSAPGAGHCFCVAFYLCDAGVLSPDVASQVDMRQVSTTGRCDHDNEQCCLAPKAPTKSPTPLAKCSCTGRAFCSQEHVQPLRQGSGQPKCHAEQVCCTNPRPIPTGGSGTHGPGIVVPSTQRPDYDVWKFCKSYPLSVACVHSRQMNTRPTLHEPAYFNPNEDARKLHSAIGWVDATDSVLIDILCKRTFSQRALISQSYAHTFGKNLYDAVTRTTRGHFENLMQALLKGNSYYDYLAKALHDGMDRLGTDEDAVLETLISSTNDEIAIIKPLYYAIERDTLKDDIESDFSGHLEDLLVALVEGNRDNSFVVSKSNARQQAEALYRAADSGLAGLGTDEDTFKQYLTHESYPQLALIFSEYGQLSGESFTETLEDEFSRHLEDAVLAIVEVTRNLPRYFAIRLHDALWSRGLFKDNSSLIRIIVSRAELDLGTIEVEYFSKYGRELIDDIKLKSTGDYQKAFMVLLGHAETVSDIQ